jgi:hypothetical protein
LLIRFVLSERSQNQYAASLHVIIYTYKIYLFIAF